MYLGCRKPEDACNTGWDLTSPGDHIHFVVFSEKNRGAESRRSLVRIYLPPGMHPMYIYMCPVSHLVATSGAYLYRKINHGRHRGQKQMMKSTHHKRHVEFTETKRIKSRNHHLNNLHVHTPPASERTQKLPQNIN